MSQYKHINIYFMSGTGNTYKVTTWACEEMSKHDNEILISPFEKADPEEEIIPGEETLLGLCLPTHGFTAPWAMIRFALNLPEGRGTHAFISATRGGTKINKTVLPGFEGTTAYLMALILKVKGYDIRGVIGVDMPLNWTVLVPGVSDETAEYINIQQKPKVTAFVRAIVNGKKRFGYGTFISLFMGLLILPFSLGYLLIARFFLAKLFFSTSACDGCGICAENCPTNAIEMRGKDNPRPYWTFKCDSCMRCMNFCPKQAIEASYLLAIGLSYLLSIPAGILLSRWLSELIPFLHEMNIAPISILIQYGYILLAFASVYYVFHHLMKIKFFNKFFTTLTLTHYYRRYRQPGVKNKDMQ